MRSLIIICCIIFVNIDGFSQIGKISGVVTDTLNKTYITNAVIYLLRSKDSVIIDCVRTVNGTFKLENVPEDSLLLLVSYPSYADYSEKLTINKSSNIYLEVSLTNKVKLLEEIVIKGKVSTIKIKGDTTEYDAEAFKLPPNATAQELFKKLPGIQVTKDGQIIAQGEKVTKIFVDGEEFFSSDPSLVTQNLNADLISKVQVFNQKSELSKLTGVTDGITSKAINIKLKEDRKIGYFGRVNLSIGDKGFHTQKFFLNYFENKKKLALFGNLSNTGNYNLNEDQKVFNNNSLVDLNNNVGELDSWTGNFEGKGKPYVFLGGLHYNDNISHDKSNFSIDYRTQRLNLTGIDSTTSSYNLADIKNLFKERRNFSNYSFRHSLDGKLESQLDSTLNLKFNFSSQIQNKKSDYYFQNENLGSSNELIISEDRRIHFSGDIFTSKANLSLIKKTKKARRNILFTANQTSKEEKSDGFLYSHQQYFTSTPQNFQITDQFKKNYYNSTGFTSKITYTEPISPKSFLLFNLEYLLASSRSHIQTFQKSNLGRYDLLDSLYSNDLKYDLISKKGELGYTLINSNYYLISSVGFGVTNYYQKNQNSRDKFDLNAKNIYPSLLFSYKLAPKKRITFNYDGLVNNPTINQLQGSLVNIDPLNILVGNPNLKPSFTNTFKISYSDLKPSNEREFYLKGYLSFTSKDISFQSTIDSLGRKIFKYININGKKLFSQNITYTRRFEASNITLNLNGIFKQSTFYASSQSTNFAVNTYSQQGTFEILKSKDNVYELALEFAVSSELNKFKTKSLSDISYLSYSLTPSLNLYFFHKIKFHTDFAVNFYRKNILLEKNITSPILNAYISKAIFKNNNIDFKFSINDLFNKNVGISTESNPTLNSQSIYNVVKRYGLISVLWNFKQNKK